MQGLARLLGLLLAVTLIAGACTRSTTSTILPPPSSSPDSTITRGTSTSSASVDPDGREPSSPCDEHLYSGDPIGQGTLSSEKVQVAFLGGESPTGYTVSVHDEDGWFPVARVEPLATVVYIDSAGHRQTLDLSGAALEIGAGAASISARAIDPDGVHWTLEIAFHLDGSPCVVNLITTLHADQDREVVLFAAPVLDVGSGSFGAAKDTAILGGLDWTLAGEESQAAAATPHPLDVSWPAMALAYDGHLVGLMWDPLQKWDGANLMPQPAFASPNWLDGSASHLFALGVPTAPVWVQESLLVDERDPAEKKAAALPIVDRVVQTYDLLAGSVLKIESSIMADYPAEIPEAVQLYLDRFGLPPVPETSADAGVEAIVESYLHTAWDPATGGWYQGTFGARAPYITVASQLAAYAEQAGGDRARAVAETVAQALGPMWQSSHDPGPSSAHMDYIDYGFRTGDTEEVLDWSAGAAAAARASQRPDGSWGYIDSDNICPGSLGERGASLLGTNVIHASIILEHARITRDPASIEAGLRALDTMDAFLKPAGAQVGEVPLSHGDPWAAAWAVRAYVEGYRISGDPHHLAKAQEWAFKGIPFLYTWAHPDIPVMPFASVGVMGTSCWTYSWAGIAVQWVGLELAASLLELASVDDYHPWADIAEGIARAGVGMLDTRPQPLPGEWQEVVLTTVAPASSRGLGLSVRANQELTLPGPTEFYIDDVSLIDVSTGEKLLPNGDFDAGGVFASPWYWDSATVQEVAGNECRFGRCAHATLAGDQTLSAGADIGSPALPGHLYELRLWVKLADDPPPSSGPLFRMEYFLEPTETKWVSVFARPLTGLLPDAWDIEDQGGYAPILPERLGDALLPLWGATLHVTTLTTPDGMVAVSGLADITGLHVTDVGELQFAVAPRTGMTSHLVIASETPPSAVHVNGHQLDADRWHYVASKSLLFLTIEHLDDATSNVTVR